MSLEVLVEGGGDSSSRAQCRQAFGSLFGRLNLKKGRPRVTACGGRDDAIREFALAPRSAILLIDAEGSAETAWRKLASQRMPRSKRADRDQIFLMVQCMESWFLADLEALTHVLPGKSRRVSIAKPLEDIVAQDLFTMLKKCGYSKRDHSWRILAKVDPTKLRNASLHADRLFKRIEQG